MVVMWFSRWREFRADIAGADLAGRDNMINALRRLRGESELPKGMPTELSAFAINGELRDKVSHLFMSHPPLADRIAALQRGANAQ